MDKTPLALGTIVTALGAKGVSLGHATASRWLTVIGIYTSGIGLFCALFGLTSQEPMALSVQETDELETDPTQTP